jgi:hypothetical protein
VARGGGRAAEGSNGARRRAASRGGRQRRVKDGGGRRFDQDLKSCGERVHGDAWVVTYSRIFGGIRFSVAKEQKPPKIILYSMKIGGPVKITENIWWLLFGHRKYHVIFTGPLMAAEHKFIFSGFFLAAESSLLFLLANLKPLKLILATEKCSVSCNVQRLEPRK